MTKSSIPTASLYLDTRRIKADDKFPLKLRLTYERQSKYYRLKHSLTEEELKKAYESKSPRREYKELSSLLNQLVIDARQVITDLPDFSFEAFEKRFFRKKSDLDNIVFHFKTKITSLGKEQKVSTMELYDLSLRSLQTFIVVTKILPSRHRIPFHSITKNFLEAYESWMMDQDRSLTTVSMYLRNLRSIFNKAISDQIISQDLYPFGRYKYKLPDPRNRKKALNAEQLKILSNYEIKGNLHQCKARDIWLLSCFCNGMNMEDIANLRGRDIDGDKLTYIRNKTRSTKKSALPIEVFLSPRAKEIIDRYGLDRRTPESLIFDIISENMTPQEKKRHVKKFTRFVNQHLKILAKEIGLPEMISSNWARHSFATLAKNNGASVEFISDLLGHGDIRTTQIYMDSLEDNARKELVNKMFDFA